MRREGIKNGICQIRKYGYQRIENLLRLHEFWEGGTMHDWTIDENESEKVIQHALELGINFFDTANGYSAGTSEEYLGKAIKKNIARDQVVIASKVYFNEGRLSQKAIMREIEGTLRGWAQIIWICILFIDLIMIHRWRKQWRLCMIW